eukprot:CAMPEP_0171253204 /NCGR_PEP_ID=MMETSP0790-20130122/51581_1 /TAXON_ID=2925 /ORGANISM="Alexandrium catenella, Strain OF101" /LENGTH=82 /DNA_ID=CAMNT_0011721019 /DNA_START=1 /DNA_END=245 /DNA_ORIENTATION=+
MTARCPPGGGCPQAAAPSGVRPRVLVGGRPRPARDLRRAGPLALVRHARGADCAAGPRAQRGHRGLQLAEDLLRLRATGGQP